MEIDLDNNLTNPRGKLFDERRKGRKSSGVKCFHIENLYDFCSRKKNRLSNVTLNILIKSFDRVFVVSNLCRHMTVK